MAYKKRFHQKQIRKQILNTQKNSRNDLLERKRQQISEKKLKFNITSCAVFQNVIMSIMEELHILLTPNKEHKKVFPDVPVVGFWNDKSRKDYLIRAKLSKLEESGRCEPILKNCLVCDSISSTETFTKEACKETFKIQKGRLNCVYKKWLHLLKRGVCGEVPYVGKAKTKFCYRLYTYKRKHRAVKNR